MRRRITLITALCLSLGLAASPAAPATSHWCSDPGATAPCIVSATLNGAPITSSDITWDLVFSSETIEGSTNIRLYVQKQGAPDPYELGADSLDDVWIITIDPGSVVPRVVSAAGRDLAAARSSGSVQVTATPVVVTDNDECNASWPWSCPETAGSERVGYLDIEITDYGTWDDASQRDAFLGMNYATNVGMRSLPPEIEEDPSTGEERVLIRLANHHFRADGTTVFLGFVELRIPYLFLRRVYGIDEPSSLTSTGIAPSVSGPPSGSGSFNVTADPAGGALLVEGDGITFSNRVIRLERGKITPSKPKKLRAKRVGDRRAKLRFKLAKARGSAIKRYEAKCVGGFTVVKAWGGGSPLRAKLDPGDSYHCRVRAKSKVGFGPWSKRAKLKG